MKRAVQFLTALAAALALGSSGVAMARPHPAISSHARYVAIGSSSAAGTGIGGIKPGTPIRCGRSASNYATLLANRLGLELDDQTCGGATTEHVLGPWRELPAQIDAVTADTRLVTVTIGSNDLGFVPDLSAANCRADAIKASSQPIRCPSIRIPTDGDYAQVEANLNRIALEIARRAPQARLIFVQFLTFVPDAPCTESNLQAEDLATMKQIGDRLAAIIVRVAKAHRASLIPAYAMSHHHTHCDAVPWSTGSVAHPPQAPARWHPNAAGHAAIADALETMLIR